MLDDVDFILTHILSRMPTTFSKIRGQGPSQISGIMEQAGQSVEREKCNGWTTAA